MEIKKLQEITKAIQKAVPSILGLKFGCKVCDNNNDCLYEHEIPSGTIVRIKETKNLWKVFILDDGKEINEEDFSCCGKILGRPITLEDVLIAVKKKCPEIMFAAGKTTNGVRETIVKREFTDLIYFWRLNKPLRKQSQKTILLLHNLIYRKEIK